MAKAQEELAAIEKSQSELTKATEDMLKQEDEQRKKEIDELLHGEESGLDLSRHDLPADFIVALCSIDINKISISLSLGDSVYRCKKMVELSIKDIMVRFFYCNIIKSYVLCFSLSQQSAGSANRLFST